MCLEERTLFYVNTTKSRDDDTGEASRVRITVNVKFGQLNLDALVLRLTVKQLALDGSNQVRTCEVKVNGEIGGIHFDSLAISFVVDVLIPTAKRSGIACCGEEVQILGSCIGKIYKSKE